MLVKKNVCCGYWMDLCSFMPHEVQSKDTCPHTERRDKFASGLATEVENAISCQDILTLAIYCFLNFSGCSIGRGSYFNNIEINIHC